MIGLVVSGIMVSGLLVAACPNITGFGLRKIRARVSVRLGRACWFGLGARLHALEMCERAFSEPRRAKRVQLCGALNKPFDLFRIVFLLVFFIVVISANPHQVQHPTTLKREFVKLSSFNNHLSSSKQD